MILASQIFLVDNGSLRPEATLSLRKLAAGLAERTGMVVEPVSLLHSHKVDPQALGGQQAEILEEALMARCKEGIFEITILPLFFGNSRAITFYMPQVIQRVRESFPQLHVSIAPCLAATLKDILLITNIVEDQILATISANDLKNPKIALVDHGSPVQEVTKVRNAVAKKLQERGWNAYPCSMERREGSQYDFNDPLLEKLLRDPDFACEKAVVSMLFLQPGRHAGDGGDIAEICEDAKAEMPQLRTYRTPLVGEHECLLDLLERKVRVGVS